MKAPAAPLQLELYLGRRVHPRLKDPHEMMRPFAAALMRMWPISTRVNKRENDDPSIIEEIELATDAA